MLENELVESKQLVLFLLYINFHFSSGIALVILTLSTLEKIYSKNKYVYIRTTTTNYNSSRSVEPTSPLIVYYICHCVNREEV